MEYTAQRVGNNVNVSTNCGACGGPVLLSAGVGESTATGPCPRCGGSVIQEITPVTD